MVARSIVCAALLTGLFAVRLGAQQVLVVGPEGTPGAAFTSVQAAVDAAADGDVVLILPGNYFDVVTLEDRELVLAGVTGPAGERALLSSLIIKDAAAEHSVVVRGLDLVPFFVNDSLSILQCAGPVLVEDCAIAQPFSGIATPPRVEDSEHVVLTRCTLLGTEGLGGFPGTDGSAGLLVVRSDVALYDCDVTGGAGSDAFVYTTFLVATRGGPAVRVTDGTLLVAGCTLRGGQGGDGFLSAFCLQAADGGEGAVVDGLLRRLDSEISGGAPGVSKGCGPTPFAGADLVIQDGTITDIPQTLRRLALGSPVEPGGAVSIDISGAPFEPVILLQALAPLGQWKGGLKGTLAGAPPYLVFPLGPLGPDGTLHLAAPVPLTVLPPGLESLTIVDQLVCAAAGGGGVLSSPSMLELVADLP